MQTKLYPQGAQTKMARGTGTTPMNSFLWGHSQKPSQGRWHLRDFFQVKVLVGVGASGAEGRSFVDHSFLVQLGSFWKIPSVRLALHGAESWQSTPCTLDEMFLQTFHKQRGNATLSQSLQLQGPSLQESTRMPLFQALHSWCPDLKANSLFPTEKRLSPQSLALLTLWNEDS